MGDEHSSSDWTPERFFELLRKLGRVRVISVCGPSVFEAICTVAPPHAEGGFLNMISEAYHWHFAADRFRFVRSHDAIHERSGRRALSFELREDPETAPFLRIYVYRDKDRDFDPSVLAEFEAAHRELERGVSVGPERGAEETAA